MYFGKIDEKETTNGVGFGVSIFVSGCRNNCKGCQNKEAQNFKFGKEFTQKDLDKILKAISREYVDFFSVLGGEPFEQENIPEVLRILQSVKNIKPNIKVFIWSGYYFEDLIKNQKAKEILFICDVLIDSPFILEQRNLKLLLRGSDNQRIINLKESFKTNSVILLGDDINEWK